MPLELLSADDAVAALLRRADELSAATEELMPETLDQLLGTIAHELRNPVSPMVFQVEYMMMQVARGDESVPAAWVLEQLEGLRRRLDAFVGSLDRLLDASQIGAGTLRIECEPVDAVALVRDIAAGATDQARAGGSEIRVVSDEEQVVGHWDRLRLEQALRNLVSNAIRYAAGRDIEIRVEADDDCALLSVCDQGPGIEPDKLEYIFDRFARASAKSGGFGIGLWLVKRITQALGGEVEVESHPGAGARFSIRLPRHPRTMNGPNT